MTLEEILSHLSEQLDELSEREEAGEDVAEERARLEAQKKDLEDQKGNESEDELTKLRREVSERSRRDLARSLAEQAVSQAVVSQRKDEEQLAQMVQSEMAKLMGAGEFQSVVSNVLSSTRTGSRFAGEYAAPGVVEHLAAGGTVVDNKMNAIRVEEKGAKAEAKEIRESKNFGRFFSIVAKASRGEMWLSAGEKEFLRSTKAMSEGTDSAGGFLIPEEWMPDVLGLLRASAVVRAAGPRFVPFNKQMNQTNISSGASASYAAENARITPSEIVVGEAVLMTLKNLTAMIPVSNYLLADASGVDTMIRDDLVEVIALREDLAFLRGAGAGGEPVGLRNKTGVTFDPITPPADGFQPSMADLRMIRAFYLNNNAGAVDLAWFFHPAFFAYLSTQTDADGHFLLDANLLTLNPDGRSGVLDGTRFYMSTQLPINLTQGNSANSSDLMLVNMRECIVGINQELELATSTEAAWTADGTNWNSAFQQNQTLFRAVVRHDIAHRRPSQIVVQKGVLV